jgi:hypothetical protein
MGTSSAFSSVAMSSASFGCARPETITSCFSLLTLTPVTDLAFRRLTGN